MAFSKERRRKLEQRTILSQDSPFLMKEDYKALRTNISFSFADSESKIFAITSSARSEGKSTNAINLAISFAELGKKVLLIDCDLRLPTISTKLSLAEEERAVGLSDLIVGRVGIKEAVKKHDSIWVMPAGTLPPDPTKLLDSPRMKNLMAVLKKTFDYIVMDCPPVTEVIDAAIIAPSVDGYLMVVKHEESDSRNIDEMVAQLERSNARILGFVYVNAPDSNKKYYKKSGYYRKSAD